MCFLSAGQNIDAGAYVFVYHTNAKCRANSYSWYFIDTDSGGPNYGLARDFSYLEAL